MYLHVSENLEKLSMIKDGKKKTHFKGCVYVIGNSHISLPNIHVYVILVKIILFNKCNLQCTWFLLISSCALSQSSAFAIPIPQKTKYLLNICNRKQWLTSQIVHTVNVFFFFKIKIAVIQFVSSYLFIFSGKSVIQKSSLIYNLCNTNNLNKQRVY